MFNEEVFQAACERGALRRQQEPMAVAAAYEPIRRRIVVALNNGADFSFPVDLAEGLSTASPQALNHITLLGGGIALHWPDLDVNHLVSNLLRGVFGFPAWMAQREAPLSPPPAKGRKKRIA